MTSQNQPLVAAIDDNKSRPDMEKGQTRSRLLEFIGVFSAVAFFVGIFFAFRTNAGGMITQYEFDQLKTGQTLEEVEDVLGMKGTAEPNSIAVAQEETYVWENTTESRVTCVFTNGQLSKMNAENLP